MGENKSTLRAQVEALTQRLSVLEELVKKLIAQNDAALRDTYIALTTSLEAHKNEIDALRNEVGLLQHDKRTRAIKIKELFESE